MRDEQCYICRYTADDKSARQLSDAVGGGSFGKNPDAQLAHFALRRDRCGLFIDNLSARYESGITLAIWLMFKPDGLTYKNGAVYFDISAVTLLLTSAACYAVIRLISYFMRRNAPDSHTATVRIDYRGKEAECAALIDTGSSLKEPFSSYPAIVFEYGAIASVLPDEIKELVRREIKEDEAYACRCVRFISFRSVGGSGLLPAIKIDKATVKTAKGIFVCSETYAAIYSNSLSGGEYSALIGNNFFDRAERGGSKNEKAESGNTKTDKTFSQPQRPGRGTLHKRLRDTACPAEKR